MEEVYFIYTLIGGNYIKPVLHSFSDIPKNANVVIITNTPEILNDIKSDFNLIIADFESLRDDISRNNEVVICNPDDNEYMTELIQKYHTGYKFPMGIMRYGLKWAINHNITKLVLVDCGIKIGYSNPLPAIDIFNNITSHKNILFGNPQILREQGEKPKLLISNHFRDIFDKYNIEIDGWSETMPTEWGENTPGSITFEGCQLGFWFKDITALEMYFNLWNELIKRKYELKMNIDASNWIDSFEWVSNILNSVFSSYFDTIIYGHHDITWHFCQPENDYFGASVKFRDDEYINTSTREEFLKINRNRIIRHYGISIDKIKHLVWGFE